MKQARRYRRGFFDPVLLRQLGDGGTCSKSTQCCTKVGGLIVERNDSSTRVDVLELISYQVEAR